MVGCVGLSHLYKPKHDDGTTNWTGFLPDWTRHVAWDRDSGKCVRLNHRFFLGIRAQEIQNNLWDYYPFENVYEDGHDTIDAPHNTYSYGQTDKYKGGFIYQGCSWGRYLHIVSLKSNPYPEDKGIFR